MGRATELRILRETVTRIEHEGAALVVRGDPGIGKSSLLREAAKIAEAQGWCVVHATGVEAESGLPYAGLHRLLQPLLGDASRLPIAQRRSLLVAFGLEDGPAPQLFVTALAALGLLSSAAARQPVVAVIDDVQWLDGPSREVLGFICRRVADEPVALLVGLRSGYEGVAGLQSLETLTLTALDEFASRQLLDEQAVELSVAQRELVIEHAAGNPLALVELPIALQVAGAEDPIASVPMSSRLERAFAYRVDDLPPSTRDALLVAAVDDENEVSEILAAGTVLAGIPLGLEVLEPAARGGLLQFDERRLQFRHPLVRSGILHSESPSRVQAAHAALAAVLAHHSYRRTWHRSQAIVGPDDGVADDLEVSSQESIRRGWVEAAVIALERSAQLTADSAQRGRRLLVAAEHAFGLGRVDLVDRLVTAAERNDLQDLDIVRLEWLREIFNDGEPGDAERVFELCDYARQAADADDIDLSLNLLLGAALRCWWADTGPAARRRVARTADSLASVRHDPRHIAAIAVAEPVLRGREVIERLDAIRVESVTDADALRVLGMAAHAVGHQVRAAVFLDRAESRLRAQGRLGLLLHVMGMAGAVRLDLGDVARSIAASEEGRLLAADTGQPVWDTGTLVNEARASAIRAESAKALALAAQADNDPARRALNDFLACAQLARGFAYITEGRFDEACTALLRLFDPGDPTYHQREQFCGVMYLAEAAVHSGRLDEARRVVAELENIAIVTPSPLLHVQLLYARAVLAAPQEAEEYWRQALAADLTQWPLPRARIQHAYGGWLRRQRRVSEAREPLRAAVLAFEAIGVEVWAERARAELRAAGERRELTSGPVASSALSPQELQIAVLAAEGLSNRAIAEKLYLSPRTVGSHLYRIFPKLDVTSRAQLAARLRPDADSRR